ncbi:DUF1640 domain-containing protein [Duganella sp. FT135W]|uniref:DUF1640 domain-containing protein n=1 Tax=Duganella flavida TaxID=2692175 RepID=A0A6L8KA80_9BURK|nr:DUF1640 domain-containing protein [Duganella flavida]MYM22754.1 DUF1640 domain-containing protein [Duganella flavida]
MAMFDTLSYVKKLTDAGVPYEHAVAQARSLNEVLSQALSAQCDALVPKTDFPARLESIKHDLDMLRLKVESLQQDLSAPK